jgi:ABC-type branched-subunit amino acid transport system ATPase component
VFWEKKGRLKSLSPTELADQYLVMERGEIIARGRGAQLEADGVRALVSI